MPRMPRPRHIDDPGEFNLPRLLAALSRRRFPPETRFYLYCIFQRATRSLQYLGQAQEKPGGSVE